MNKSIPVVFIMSTMSAGSTLLGLVLGSHSSMGFLGEPVIILDRNQKSGGWLHHHFCSVCQDVNGGACPIWDKHLIENMRTNGEDLYHLVLQKFRKVRVLIDGSKSLPWLEEGRTGRGIQPFVIHVSKSAESFVASMTMRYQYPMNHQLKHLALKWAKTNREIREYAARTGVTYVHIKYLDFVRDPFASLNQLSHFLSFTPEPEQLKFWAQDHHYVRSHRGITTNFRKDLLNLERETNRSLYEQNYHQIFVDEKWKTCLTEKQINFLYAIKEVERESAELGYEYPFGPFVKPVFSSLLKENLMETEKL